MNISKAIELDKKARRGISRRAWHGYTSVIPTNIPGKNMILQAHSPYGPKEPGYGWEPTADDLTANDWFVYGSHKFRQRVNSYLHAVFETILHPRNSFGR